MTKRFYTCPIEAAYMADNFGLRVKPEVDKSTIRSFYGVSIYAMYLNGTCEGKMFVSPDSLSIFEPQEGDLVKHGFNCPDCGEQISTWGEPFTKYLSAPFEGITIIQRNNKSFIMPEVEE